MSPEEHQHEDAVRAERRLSALERQFTELSAKVDRVGLEQTYQRELINTRFGTLEKSIELVSTQMAGVSRDIQTMASDVDKSPAGRQIQREVADLRGDVVDACQELSVISALTATLKTRSDQFDGALGFARTWAVSSTIVALAAVILLVLKGLKVIP